MFIFKLISFWLCWASVAVRTFLCLRRWGTALWSKGLASGCSGFSCGAQALGHSGFHSRGARGIFRDQGFRPTSPAWQAEPPGKPPAVSVYSLQVPFSAPGTPLALLGVLAAIGKENVGFIIIPFPNKPMSHSPKYLHLFVAREQRLICSWLRGCGLREMETGYLMKNPK